MAINEEMLKDADIESVAQPNADFRESIDDALIAAEVRSEKRDYDRLKKLEEDGKINIDVQGNALKNEDPGNDNGDGDDEKKGGFAKFASGVGKALGKFSQGLEKKLETIYDDKEKTTLFLSGLNTLIESSSYAPITQAKSPIGKIASGVKKGFLESEAIDTKRKKQEVDLIKSKAQLQKALKGEPPRFINR